MTAKELKSELKNIQYYYKRAKVFMGAKELIGNLPLMEKIQFYNSLINTMDMKLIDIYVSLYINNHTQESLANELCVTQEYVQKLHKLLIVELCEKINQLEYSKNKDNVENQNK